MDNVQIDINELLNPLSIEVGQKAIEIAQQKAVNAELKRQIESLESEKASLIAQLEDLANPTVEEVEVIE